MTGWLGKAWASEAGKWMLRFSSRCTGPFRIFTLTSLRCLAAGKRRDHSRHYLQALLVQSGERRNAENLSETVPASARVMQRFLAESPWDDDTVIGRLQEYLGPRIGHPEAVLGTGRQRLPQAGQEVPWEWPVSIAGGWARWPAARPECSWPMSARWAGPWWTSGCICRRAGPRTKTGVRRGGVPEERQGYRFEGRNWRWRCWGGSWSGAHLRAGWVAGDDAFGMSPSFREGLAAQGMWYVLDVPGGTTVWPLEPAWTSADYQGFGRPRKPKLVDGQRRTMEQRSEELPGDAWREITVAERSQGPRSHMFSAQRVRVTQEAQARRDGLGRLPPEPGRQRTPLLLVQRSGGYPVGDPGIRGRLPVAH